ncbi:MAG: L-rhamnose mutarotase [Pyrinomonadaceae bacterium]
MIRKALLMQVNADAHDEYERRHQPIWEELETTLKEHGVANYSIYLAANTNQLFGYVEIESEERWAAIADTEVCKRWWAFMKDVMPTKRDNSPVSVELREVFDIER